MRKDKLRGRQGDFVQLILQLLVVAGAVGQCLLHEYYNVFLCVLTLLAFNIPRIIDRRFHVKIPVALEIVILLFIYAHMILGEISSFYTRFPYWDTMLHTINGFLMAAIGFSMIDILNQHPRVHISMSPIFVAFVAFCFSMTIGILWEFFEFAMDQFAHTDMQKDFFVTSLYSVAINPSGLNEIVPLSDIQKTVVYYLENGERAAYVMNGGYLDVGIIDTMKDLIVNCIGAVVFSVIGIVYIKNRGRGKVAESFIPQLKTDAEIEETKAEMEMQRLKLQLKREEIRSYRKLKKTEIRYRRQKKE